MHQKIQTCFIGLLWLIFSCHNNTENQAPRSIQRTKAHFLKISHLKTESSLQAAGLIDITSLDSSIIIDIKYASTHNFLKTNIYNSFNKAYLQKEVAQKLVNAQKYLQQKYPHYTLVIYDAYRPTEAQQRIWDAIDLPIHEKIKYASNPKWGSLHSFGAAVDVSIIDKSANTLDMGSAFDSIGQISQPIYESKMFQENHLTETQINNRKLLRQVMHQAGFFNIQTEWWHFNSCTRIFAIQHYSKISVARNLH